MAIKVIKQGVKEFNITCPNCGCEFTYEYEDVGIGVVPCPCCQAHLPHKGVNGTVPYVPPIWFRGDKLNDLVYRPIKLPDWSTVSDCENCPNNPKYLKTPYIGDSPCQWCQKNPNKITCTSGGSNV